MTAQIETNCEIARSIDRAYRGSGNFINVTELLTSPKLLDDNISPAGAIVKFGDVVEIRPVGAVSDRAK
jgi:hypothetical protein